MFRASRHVFPNTADSATAVPCVSFLGIWMLSSTRSSGASRPMLPRLSHSTSCSSFSPSYLRFVYTARLLVVQGKCNSHTRRWDSAAKLCIYVGCPRNLPAPAAVSGVFHEDAPRAGVGAESPVAPPAVVLAHRLAQAQPGLQKHMRAQRWAVVSGQAKPQASAPLPPALCLQFLSHLLDAVHPADPEVRVLRFHRSRRQERLRQVIYRAPRATIVPRRGVHATSCAFGWFASATRLGRGGGYAHSS